MFSVSGAGTVYFCFQLYPTPLTNVQTAIPCISPKSGGAVTQSVERATPGEEVAGSIPAVAARSLLVGSVSV